MRVVVLLAALVLAGCGVDGEPEPKGPGIAISGEATIGISGTL